MEIFINRFNDVLFFLFFLLFVNIFAHYLTIIQNAIKQFLFIVLLNIILYVYMYTLTITVCTTNFVVVIFVLLFNFVAHKQKKIEIFWFRHLLGDFIILNKFFFLFSSSFHELNFLFTMMKIFIRISLHKIFNSKFSSDKVYWQIYWF